MPIRTGRLRDEEKLLILNELGEIARKKYNQFLFFGAGNYHLRLLKDSLKFEPNIETFENTYWVDTGSKKLNDIALYFEYGTGIKNINRKSALITPRKKQAMVFSMGGKTVFAKSTKGVRPIFMLLKTIYSMQHERKYLQQKIRRKLGI